MAELCVAVYELASDYATPHQQFQVDPDVAVFPITDNDDNNEREFGDHNADDLQKGKGRGVEHALYVAYTAIKSSDIASNWIFYASTTTADLLSVNEPYSDQRSCPLDWWPVSSGETG